MRTRSLLVTVAVVVMISAFALGTAPASAGGKAPVKLDGKVNVHGTKNASKSPSAKLKIELDSYYISPTFTKVQPGEQLTVELKNNGPVAHTFTSDDLNVDKQLQPGKSAKLKITIPDDAKVFEFYCRFHEANGMKSAFYTA